MPLRRDWARRREPDVAERLLVVGGGIAGLAAAERLASEARRGGSDAIEVVLLEASERFGGNVRTVDIAGRPIDVGAEAMMARVPGVLETCGEFGLEERVVSPRADGAYVWTDQLRPLPPGLLSGLPGGGSDLARSRILSPAGLARASADLAGRSRPLDADESIGSLVRRRLGDEVVRRLIDPLLGGIHAADCDELSVKATAPMLAAAVATGKGIVRGLRVNAPQPRPGPMFISFQGGLEELASAFRSRLSGVECRTGAAVRTLERDGAGEVAATLADGTRLCAQHVILAVPAYAAGELLASLTPAASRELQAIAYASVATLVLTVPRATLDELPSGSGFLSERRRGHTITAATFSSQKWEHLDGPETALLKCSVGYSGDESPLLLADDELVAAACSDLVLATGARVEPLDAEVFRFDRALPQYAVGHADRVARIERGLADVGGVTLCGAAYHGAGVGACVADGRAAAAAALEALTARRPSALGLSAPAAGNG